MLAAGGGEEGRWEPESIWERMGRDGRAMGEGVQPRAGRNLFSKAWTLSREEEGKEGELNLGENQH